ncbi:redoxin family protein, partial [Halothiobacillus sp.]|uniref:redoxin family protein n=1 Tax=Halothiobacillus sp. TaxID=1891311 RepID=UPI002AD4A64B
MLFAIIATDHPDRLQQRLAFRSEHRARLDALQAEGRLLTAQLVDLSGSPVDLQAQQGRPMVLNLWATWCPPCRREMPMMVDVAQAQDEVDIVFANQGETTESIGVFLEQSGLPPTGILRDPNSALMQ